MIICFDVGNTDIVMGVFCDDKIVFSGRFRYVKGLSEREYLPFIVEKMRIYKIDCKKIQGCVLCCVVENTTDNLALAMELVFGTTPILFKNDDRCKMQVAVGNPQEVGLDIMAGCMAVKKLYPMPAIVIDMGTATTITAMDNKGAIRGVSILPGVFISMWALRDRTSLMVDETLSPPKNAIGITTRESLASGIVLGSAYAIDGMIEAFCEEIGERCNVIATGGAARFIVPSCKKEVTLNDDLLLLGLYCYYKNCII